MYIVTDIPTGQRHQLPQPHFMQLKKVDFLSQIKAFTFAPIAFMARMYTTL